jgi:hypothetical protein
MCSKPERGMQDYKSCPGLTGTHRKSNVLTITRGHPGPVKDPQGQQERTTKDELEILRKHSPHVPPRKSVKGWFPE